MPGLAAGKNTDKLVSNHMGERLEKSLGMR
ncbi:hypothetical protein ABIE66_000703 [Peribacillus sp. B2I2]